MRHSLVLPAPQFKDLSKPFVEVCPHTTRSKCDSFRASDLPNGESSAAECPLAHFRIRHFPQTEPNLGDCSYLNTCHRLDTCRYLHYELETPRPEKARQMREEREARVQRVKQYEDLMGTGNLPHGEKLLPPQWLDCDLRKLDMTVLGTFDVIMADPPWDIHMTLPYGTISDDDMKAMPLGKLQNDGGLLFLWVTGRAVGDAVDAVYIRQRADSD